MFPGRNPREGQRRTYYAHKDGNGLSWFRHTPFMNDDDLSSRPGKLVFVFPEDFMKTMPEKMIGRAVCGWLEETDENIKGISQKNTIKFYVDNQVEELIEFVFPRETNIGGKFLFWKDPAYTNVITNYIVHPILPQELKILSLCLDLSLPLYLPLSGHSRFLQNFNFVIVKVTN
eukprot:GHVP01042979.1.p1 GENE.GHVP01042979.1~~GHVP01042979.1.p1  ORF type:complete len:174 (+),score=26.60 GHVP01042979.1:207-728(+)